MVAEQVRWNIRDLEVMPDDGGWKRYEIIDGALFVTRAPHIQHQGSGSNLWLELELWSRQTNLGKPFVAPGVVFDPENAVIPDVVWASQETLSISIDEAGHFTRAPELVVEVLSEGIQQERRDREAKLKLYSQHGVQEYWIVDWRSKQIEVYRRENAQLKLSTTLLQTDTLTSPLLPDFQCEVHQIFSAYA